ncbi:MAG: DUF4249 domain-containing protein [Crocinitomicaceae bacterium]|nr:DUF4249 domain-containing protein [Crocinitomicaceae bacterium]
MRIVGLIIFIVVIASCEKIIDVNIPDSDPQIVIEGKISTDTNVYSVLVSKTVPYNSTSNSYVDNAVVSLTDDLGNTQVLNSVGNGEYQTALFSGQVGRTYTLTVQNEGVVYSNYSSIQSPVQMDSIHTVFIPANTFPGVEEGIYPQIYYTDLVGLGDRYRMIFSRNDTVFNSADDYFLFNDVYDDGLQEVVSLFGKRFKLKPGDKVKVELWKLDEHVYDYYQTLENIISQGFAPTGVPDNPNSTWTNGALGVFNAYSYSVDSLIVQ